MDNEPTSDLWTEAAAGARKRLQRRSVGWWRGAAAGGGTRADRVAALVAALAALDPTNPSGAAPPRPERDETLADQLAVVLHDLRLAGVDPETALEGLARALQDVDPRT